MEVDFKRINVEDDFQTCVDFRRDSYFCSFDTYEGFEASIVGYQDNLFLKVGNPDYFYFHLWAQGKIIGQLEFRAFSELADTGYVNLIYLISEYRGSGLAAQLQQFIAEQLMEKGCKGALLSVSRTNRRALNHYQGWGWQYFSANPKHAMTDFYRRHFSPQDTE
ncbi:GNAT family N-acetyltransferase [Marinomonas transparens]|uniref:GNAT family N-acetyltransferase n=1 Tax=Marinomonas transparens TaxID=2795388 RepID=A0A934JPK6_9GAMM|nr:GNAT family N-acetyltransferase [Marinomonas transparens]MBJ7537423.1 GNAT family N-acetyltransferase [Marinomonas transparens]